MGFPNWTRSFEYLMAASSAPWEMPTPWAPMSMRETSSVCMTTLKPSPSPPSRLSLGTMQSSMMSSQLPVARMPIRFSCLPTLKPLKSFSTMKALMPLWRSSGLVYAKMTNVSAAWPLVIHAFVPFMT